MEGTTQNLDAFRKEQETLLHELGLIEGMPVSLAKVVEENPELPQSQAVNGFLDRMGQFGYAISVNNGESSTPHSLKLMFMITERIFDAGLLYTS